MLQAALLAEAQAEAAEAAGREAKRAEMLAYREQLRAMMVRQAADDEARDAAIQQASRRRGPAGRGVPLRQGGASGGCCCCCCCCCPWPGLGLARAWPNRPLLPPASRRQVLDRQQAQYEAQLAAREGARRALMAEVEAIRREQIARKEGARCAARRLLRALPRRLPAAACCCLLLPAACRWRSCPG